MNCQICKKEYDYQKQQEDLKNKELPYNMNPSRYLCCSFECLIKGYRANAVISFVRLIKNCSCTPFEEFNEGFEFPIAGEYAVEKYNLSKFMPWQFICSLSNDKFVALAKNRRI